MQELQETKGHYRKASIIARNEADRMANAVYSAVVRKNWLHCTTAMSTIFTARVF